MKALGDDLLTEEQPSQPIADEPLAAPGRSATRAVVAIACVAAGMVGLVIGRPELSFLPLVVLAAAALPGTSSLVARLPLGLGLAVALVAFEGVVIGFVNVDIDRRLVLVAAFVIALVPALAIRERLDIATRRDLPLLVPYALVLVLGSIVILRDRPDYRWLQFGTDNSHHFAFVSYATHDGGLRYTTALNYPRAFHWAVAAPIGAACRGGTALHTASGTAYVYDSTACGPTALIGYYAESLVVLWAGGLVAIGGVAALLARRNRILAAGIAAAVYATGTFMAQQLLYGYFNTLAANLLILLGIATWLTARDRVNTDVATGVLGALIVLCAHTYPTLLPFLAILWLAVAARARRAVAVGVVVSGLILAAPALIGLLEVGEGHVNVPGGIPRPNIPLCIAAFAFAGVALYRRKDLRPYAIATSVLGAVFLWSAVENLRAFGHLQYYATRTLLFLVVALLPVACAQVADLLPTIRAWLQLISACALTLPAMATFDLTSHAGPVVSRIGVGTALVLHDAKTPRRSGTTPTIVWQYDVDVKDANANGALIVLGHEGILLLRPLPPAERDALCKELHDDATIVLVTPAREVVKDALSGGRCDLVTVLRGPGAASR